MHNDLNVLLSIRTNEEMYYESEHIFKWKGKEKHKLQG